MGLTPRQSAKAELHCQDLTVDDEQLVARARA